MFGEIDGPPGPDQELVRIIVILSCASTPTSSSFVVRFDCFAILPKTSLQDFVRGRKSNYEYI